MIDACMLGVIFNTMIKVIIDTNVLCAALRSRRGASSLVLRLLGTDIYEAHLTVPLFLEYHEQLGRLVASRIAKQDQVDDVLDYLCAAMVQDSVHFLWRPFLKDADDDMVVEAAVAGGCSHIITHNTRDFRGVEALGLAILTPGQFLKLIGGSS